MKFFKKYINKISLTKLTVLMLVALAMPLGYFSNPNEAQARCWVQVDLIVQNLTSGEEWEWNVDGTTDNVTANASTGDNIRVIPMVTYYADDNPNDGDGEISLEGATINDDGTTTYQTWELFWYHTGPEGDPFNFTKGTEQVVLYVGGRCRGSYDSGGNYGGAVYVTFGPSTGGGGPTTATATTDLAVYDTPTANLRVNGSTSANILVGQSANITWSTTATNSGTACTASNAWSGAKGSNPGTPYSETTGVMNTVGIYTYDIVCTGGPPATPISTPLTQVVLNVGGVPDFDLACTPFSTSITAGNPTSYNLNTTPQNGFNRPVTFTVSNIDPAPANPPTFDFGATNGQVPPATTVANLTTTPSTSTGLFTITFSGTDGIITKTCNVQLTVNSPPGPSDWSCSALMPQITVVQNTSGANTINTTKTGSFNSPVTLTTLSITPAADGITVSYNPNSVAPPQSIDAVVNVPAATPATPHTVTVRGVPISGTPHECTFIVNVQGGTGPQPVSVSTDVNSVCDQVAISWRSRGIPTPSGFQVFRGTSTTVTDPSYTPISPLLGPIERSFVDTVGAGAQESNNYYKVRAYNGSAWTDSTTGVLGNIHRCGPDLSSSNKVILKVSGRNNQGFPFQICSNQLQNVVLENNALFAPDDLITFQINICNSGSGALTNVTLKDIFSRLKDAGFTLIPPMTQSTADCIKTPPVYNSTQRTIDYELKDIAPGGICDIRFTAKIEAPPSPDSSLYKFQNFGRIFASEISADPAKYPLGYYEVRTRPISFSIAGGVPVRNETAPN